MCAYFNTCSHSLLPLINRNLSKDCYCEWGYGQIALIVKNLQENEHLGKPKCVKRMMKWTIL